MTESAVAPGKDVAYELADNVAKVEYDDLPSGVVEVTKQSILDTLGVMVGATGIIPEVEQVVDLIKQAGGKEESTILVFGGKVPAWMAAFANGAMAHSLEYDDLHYEGVVHPSTPTVPAAFALAERIGGVNGKNFITAIALGNDIMCRLGMAVTYAGDWELTPVFGVFAATAACGKLLGLNQEQLVNAFGIALCQAAGTMELDYGVGSNLRGSYPAFPAKGGVLSTLMAQRGVSAPKNSFEGRAGLFNVYFKGDYDRETLTSELGKRFEGINTGFKPWPTCGLTHVYIEGTLSLVQQHNIQPDDIEGITLFVGKIVQALSEPREQRIRPLTALDAMDSALFGVAVAAVRRQVGVGDFSIQGLKDERVLRMAEKVTTKIEHEFDVQKGIPPGLVKITIKGGKEFQKRIDVPYGHPSNPMSLKDIVQKFGDCVAYSAKPLVKDNVEKVIDMVTTLDKLDDVSPILGLLVS